MEELTWVVENFERERKEDNTRKWRRGVVHMQVRSEREEERTESGCETERRSDDDGEGG